MIRAGKPEIEAIARAIEAGNLFRYSYDPSQTTETDAFEREWAELVGTKHALAVTSGTAALICALAALEIGPGDEVIIPGYTFMATAAAVAICGAIPVLAEIDETLLLDPADLEAHITARTKAIIPVHMWGMPCDMDRIMSVAKKHKLHVIEDACQMDAGSYKGRRVGSIGEIGCFSFNYFKIITCGEGGAITTDSDDAYQRALVMHDSGLAFRPFADTVAIKPFIGLNFRLSNILGAMLRVQLTQVDGWLESMRAIKARMEGELKERGVKVSPSNDPEGDCGLALGILLESEEMTQRCMAELDGKLGYTLPFDTDRHVYSNWDPILEHRVYHHPGMNPYLHPANQECQIDYQQDMLPRTLDILKRSLLFGLNPFMEEAEIARNIDIIEKAVATAAAARV